ncbi:MAG: FG-GAP-like repeat-containing protein [Rhodothermales bacterium]
MKRLLRFNPWLIIFLLFTLFGVQHAFGQSFSISSVVPRAYSSDSRPFDPIRITFSDDVNMASVGVDNIAVYGSETGRCFGTVSYEAGTQTVIYDPPCTFKEGELVSVIVSGVTSAGGAVAPPYQWQFTPRVEYGTGEFNGPFEFSLGLGKEPVSLFAADFNGDLFADLAVANSAAGTVSIMINQRNGLRRFSQVTDITVGMRPFSITGGDLNSDGQIDLLVSNLLGNTLTLLTNQGNGVFTPTTIETGERPKRAEVFDLDNDGFQDIVVAAFGIDELWVHRNNGDATFAAPDRYAVGASPSSVLARDWDADGYLDLYVASLGDQQLDFLRNTGSGGFEDPIATSLPFSPEALVSGDLLGIADNRYGDTLVDLAVSAQDSRDIWVFQNTGNAAALQPAVTFAVDSTSSPALGLVIADLDTTDTAAEALGMGKDYDLDLVSSHFIAGEIRPFINSANTSFAPGLPTDYPAAQLPIDANPTGIAASDFDGDGDMDLAYVNTNSGKIGVLYNAGGREAPLIVFPEALAFGEVCVDGDSTQAVLLENNTNYPLTVEISVRPDEGVYFPDTTMITLAPGQREAVSVLFGPLAARDYAAELVLRSTVDASACGDNFEPIVLEQTVELTGRGVQSMFTVAPDTLDFGVVVIGSPQTQQALLDNQGNIEGQLAEYLLSDPVNFAVLSPNLPAVIGAMSQGSVEVSFQPTIAGDYLESLQIVTADQCGGDTLQVYLRATALDPFPDLEPIDLAPTAGLVTTGLRTGDPMQLEVSIQNSFIAVADSFVSRFSVTQPDGSVLPFGDIILPGMDIEVIPGLLSDVFTFTQEGAHVFCFDVDVNMEIVEQSDDNNQLCLNPVDVRPMLPDLVAENLSRTDASIDPIRRGQRRDFTGLFSNTGETDIVGPFQVEIRSNGQVVASMEFDGLAVGVQQSFTAPVDFPDTGMYTLSFFVDGLLAVDEITEENNEFVLEAFDVEAPDDLAVEPNPFTPNGDTFNDEITFQVTEFGLLEPVLRIFSFEGRLIRTEADLIDGFLVWNGQDESGRDQRPGVYLYTVEDENNVVASGHITLAR